MINNQSFIEQVLEQISPICPVIARAMFGGYGLFSNNVMFGLIANDMLYFKVDGENRDDFVNAGAKPFIYERKHKPIQMSYYRLPQEAFVDTAGLAEWVELAIAAGRRAKTKNKTKKPIKRHRSLQY